MRDPLIEAYISTLAPPPEVTSTLLNDDIEARGRKHDRERREKALAEREKRVLDEKRRQQGVLQHSKGMLQEGEAEIERAMRIGRDGLKSQLGVGLDHRAETTIKPNEASA